MNNSDLDNIDWTLDFSHNSTTIADQSMFAARYATTNQFDLPTTQEQRFGGPEGTDAQFQAMLDDVGMQTASLDFLGSSLTDSMPTNFCLETAHPTQTSSTPNTLGADFSRGSRPSSRTSLAGPASGPLETVSPASDDSHSHSGSHRVEGGRVDKRQRNTEAARRYRQRKLDKLSTVEDALLAVTKERDELRLELARARAEADILKGMVAQKQRSSN
ncbi:uncharacterized protein K489DRAFT_23769 [Dissoconium aciculare CBS 342.82]|uniref:BZIP domain-containing protein n=1 Tax=Dissoconium aciculare CBS 342.82 TaxID=1314786 RepID=A0A6J3MIE2_9PEZI|nr:uncharacterized protein K489DRAFT_23769 [Dissoconium aciculare CBS 342.82]KAF1827673.1 hypothetical protein K489DRAFT_23769 [Dissoconium aciculare CBS 342.82]